MLLYVVLLLLLLLPLLLVKLKICVTFLNNFAAYRTARLGVRLSHYVFARPFSSSGVGSGNGVGSGVSKCHA